MKYKNKLILLLSLIAVMSLLYTGSFIFNYEHASARSASFVWLDQKTAQRIDKIVINSSDQNVELVKEGNLWFVMQGGNEYPARQLRIEDFINILTKRGAWPVRSSNASSHERVGLDVQSAFRITFFTEGAVSLDLLTGGTDSTGREIYMRKYQQDEVRCGDSLINTYITGPAAAWYNLRLIPQSEDGQIDLEDVQRLSVYNQGESAILSRRNRDWDISGIYVENPAQDLIENYIRNVLNSEGDNFYDNSGSLNFEHSRIVLEFGNGSIVTIGFSEPDETGRRIARVSGSPYLYSIPSWMAMRLFTNAAGFERR